MHAIKLDESNFKEQRIVNMVGLTVTVSQMLEALTRKGGEEARQRVSLEPNAEITRIIQSWPARFASTRGKELGFTAEDSFDEIIDNFMADDMVK